MKNKDVIIGNMLSSALPYGPNIVSLGDLKNAPVELSFRWLISVSLRTSLRAPSA